MGLYAISGPEIASLKQGTRDAITGKEFQVTGKSAPHIPCFSRTAVFGENADSQLDERPVRIQWDPERDWRLNPIDGIRAIQIGLAGEAVHHYVNTWVLHIEDVTTIAHAMALAAKSRS